MGFYSIVFCLAVVLLIFYLARALYYVSPFHPLSRFPGPWYASVGYFCEAFYDSWWYKGQYTNVIKRWHEIYGPIIRINPHELHCSEPGFGDQIYNGERDKWEHQLNTGSGAVKETFFSEINHKRHSTLKTPIAMYFSPAQVARREDDIYELCKELVEQMLTLAGKEPFDVKNCFDSLTADIISMYIFGAPMGFVVRGDFENNFASWTASFFEIAYPMRHNPLLRQFLRVMPVFAPILGKDIQAVMRVMNITIPELIDAARKHPKNGGMFGDLMANKSSSFLKDNMKRLSGEGFNFMLAGTETTSAILTVFMYRVLEQPAISERIRSEFFNANLDAQHLRYNELKKCPYFVAVIRECLRMQPGVSHRSARISRTEDLIYKSLDGTVVIPSGTPIGMSPMINHWNERLFPNPDSFNPERWLEPNDERERAFLSFGKGTRSCIGQELAMYELYLAAASMVLCVVPRAKLVDTTVKSISYAYDAIVPRTKNGPVSARIAIN